MDPVTHFSEFSINAPSPSGNRHNSSGIAYVKEISINPNESLDFGTLNNSDGQVVDSETKCVVWCVDDFKDATQKIYDMKFWLSSIAGFVGEGSGNYNVYFNWHTSNEWMGSGNPTLVHTSGNYVPRSLPSEQNLYKYDGSSSITTSGSDESVSQYIYLSTSVDPNTPNGQYGGMDGGFRYRITYKYL